MNHENTQALILAAGKGTRMYSARPKVLQSLGGRAMITHLLDTLQTLQIARTAIVHGYLGELIQQSLSSNYPALSWVAQEEQLGTAHAVLQALPLLQDDGTTLILLGDCPLLAPDTLQALLQAAQVSGMALLTAEMADATGYGRIIRDETNQIISIVEEKDATAEQRNIKEINTGVMAVSNALLREFLPKIENNNAQEEYYLTDLIELLCTNGHTIAGVIAKDVAQVLGINNRAQLAQAEAIYRKRQAQKLLDKGVTLIDPSRIDVHGTLSTGNDVVIEPNVMFKGDVVLGDGVYIESGCVLDNCNIGSNSVIHAMSIVEKSNVAEAVHVGPFARIRPNSSLEAQAKVGNFVEIKAAHIAKGSKVNHLSYIGDAVLGENVNIGAGTITCNYDGANKFKTAIGDNVFVGSNTALVAPITLGDGATIGAGSVLTNDVNAGDLAFTRAALKVVEAWERPAKIKKD